MNSFNHYAYGAVADWIYGVAAGIQPAVPGYGRVRIAPHPTDRLTWLEASVETRRGLVSSKWTRTASGWRFDIVTPVEAEIALPGETKVLPAGSYVFHVDKA